MRKPAAKKGRNKICCVWKRRGWKKESRNDWEYNRGVRSPVIESRTFLGFGVRRVGTRCSGRLDREYNI